MEYVSIVCCHRKVPEYTFLMIRYCVTRDEVLILEIQTMIRKGLRIKRPALSEGNIEGFGEMGVCF